MKKLFRFRNRVIVLLALGALLAASCGGSDYQTLSVREGIGHFSMEYSPAYQVKRIDISNDQSGRYTYVGLSTQQSDNNSGFNEISVYAWLADENDSASAVLEGMLARAGTIFPDFKTLQRFSVMVGDMEGQAAIFSWMVSATDASNQAPGIDPLPAISRIVCFRHDELAWEIHVASDELTLG